jgi:hypothetical protein
MENLGLSDINDIKELENLHYIMNELYVDRALEKFMYLEKYIVMLDKKKIESLENFSNELPNFLNSNQFSEYYIYIFQTLFNVEGCGDVDPEHYDFKNLVIFLMAGDNFDSSFLEFYNSRLLDEKMKMLQRDSSILDCQKAFDLLEMSLINSFKAIENDEMDLRAYFYAHSLLGYLNDESNSAITSKFNFTKINQLIYFLDKWASVK